MRFRFAPVVATIILMAGFDLAGASPTDAPARIDIPCDFVVPNDLKARCSRVVLPENRTIPSGRVVILPVVVLSKPDRRHPEAAPVLYLAGGPGSPSGLDGDSIPRWFEEIREQPWLQERDLVLFDQRGAGRSIPALKCPELIEAWTTNFKLPPSVRTDQPERNAARICRDEWAVDITQYGTRQNAEDVRDIRELLGISSWILFGGSYGTRVALQVAQQDSTAIKAMILRGISPPGAKFYPEPEEMPDRFERALRRVFSACHDDDACDAAYPNLETAYKTSLDKLKQYPIQGTVRTSINSNDVSTFTIDSILLKKILVRFLSDYREMAGIPFIVKYLSDRNYSNPVSLEGDQSLIDLLSSMTQSSQNEALRQIVECNDSPRLDKGKIEPCRDWEISSTANALTEVAPSDISALFTVGEFDPLTPPFWARAVAAKYPNSYLIQYPNQSHVLDDTPSQNACFAEIVKAFLARPYREPPTSCLGDPKPIVFLIPNKD